MIFRRTFSSLSLAALFAVCGLVVLAGAGCSGNSGEPAKSDDSASRKPHSVTVVKPQRATLQRTVRQPGQIQAYEQTPIYPKISGFVLKWHVDIGDFVKEKQVLAELYVPEMDEELKRKEKAVVQAEKAHEVARKKVATAAALIKEAEAGLLRARANHERWRREYDRISKLTGSVIDLQIKDETWNQLQATLSAWNEAKAKVATAKAALDEARAIREKTQADIPVAEFDRRHYAALVAYKRLTAPVWKEPKSKTTGGVVTRRNINTDDFVQPPTAGKGDPLYVVERRDLMRIFVEVPEADAAWVKKGSPARIVVEALQGQEVSGKVVRTSYALDRTSRTLLAEIDVPNPGDRLRPNMYVLATIMAEHEGVWTLPGSAVVTQGEITKGYESYCFVVDKQGKAKRTLLKLGVRDGQRVEILKKQTAPAEPGGESPWVDLTGEEEVIESDPGSLADGQEVVVQRNKK